MADETRASLSDLPDDYGSLTDEELSAIAEETLLQIEREDACRGESIRRSRDE